MFFFKTELILLKTKVTYNIYNYPNSSAHLTRTSMNFYYSTVHILFQNVCVGTEIYRRIKFHQNKIST